MQIWAFTWRSSGRIARLERILLLSIPLPMQPFLWLCCCWHWVTHCFLHTQGCPMAQPHHWDTALTLRPHSLPHVLGTPGAAPHGAQCCAVPTSNHKTSQAPWSPTSHYSFPGSILSIWAPLKATKRAHPFSFASFPILSFFSPQYPFSAEHWLPYVCSCVEIIPWLDFQIHLVSRQGIVALCPSPVVPLLISAALQCGHHPNSKWSVLQPPTSHLPAEPKHCHPAALPSLTYQKWPKKKKKEVRVGMEITMEKDKERPSSDLVMGAHSWDVPSSCCLCSGSGTAWGYSAAPQGLPCPQGPQSLQGPHEDP